jgi:branched-chain amino acid transport system ATP-binding protein
MTDNPIMLELSGVTKQFGGLTAIGDVSFSTRKGEIFGIIGPNGAGKSTLFNLITGTYPATKGDITYKGESITKLGPEGVAAKGIVRTFQSATVFANKSLQENIRLGYLFGQLSVPRRFADRSLLSSARATAETVTDDVLSFCGLSDDRERIAGELAYGLQKILGVAMAIAAGPTQMLMDEPAAGLNPVETQEMGELIRRIRAERGIDVVLVEHDVGMVTRICDRVLVLDRGQVLAIDVPEAIQKHPEVIEAYLGADIDLHQV